MDDLSSAQKAVRGEGVPPTETVGFTKEGEPVPMIVAGEFKGIVASYTDISRYEIHHVLKTT